MTFKNILEETMAATGQTAEEKSPSPISSHHPRDVEKLYSALKMGKAKLIEPDGKSRRLPDSVYAFLVELAGALQQGKCVTILQNQGRLTTAEAANMLGVSRQFLVNLLEAGEIAYHKVGTHRRIYVQDVMKYKVKRDDRRKKTLRELVAAEVADDIYEKVPPLDPE
jgi:excisionase family DNA binding protein